MNTKISAGMLGAALAIVGVASSAMADSYIEQKTATSESCPATSVTRTMTETTAAPIVEERMTTIEKPVVLETPVVEQKIIRTNNHEIIKMKELY